MTTLVLVRHGRTAMTGPVLAGWTPGVHLNDEGREQAVALAQRLAPVPLTALVCSPLERCQDTVEAIVEGRSGTPLHTDERFAECRYGSWTGRPLKELAKDPLWKVVQAHPSAVTFPGGESLAGVQARAVAAVRDWDARLSAEHGDDAVWLACSHGDVIKAVVADALGLHLDLFQRITVDTCSATVIRYTAMRPFVVRVNDVGGDLRALIPPKRRRRRRVSSDAAVGGG
ncbi:MAG TPA: histidine phosphatase family protein [Mycobacteriales bacterium]|nr:histidine phosphatase family protein [Mycobacteriales bacterium]